MFICKALWTYFWYLTNQVLDVEIGEPDQGELLGMVQAARILRSWTCQCFTATSPILQSRSSVMAKGRSVNKVNAFAQLY